MYITIWQDKIFSLSYDWPISVSQAVWPYSGHYLPTEENFQEFIKFLRDNNVDFTGVKVNFFLILIYRSMF